MGWKSERSVEIINELFSLKLTSLFKAFRLNHLFVYLEIVNNSRKCGEIIINYYFKVGPFCICFVTQLGICVIVF